MTALPLQDREFESLMTEYQPRLFAFIYSMTKDKTQAQDVLQNTNVVLWSKREQFEMGTSFKAWSFQIAYFEAKSTKKKVIRSKENYSIDTELLEGIQAQANEQDDAFLLKRVRLKECLAQLSQEQKELVVDRYYANQSVQTMANERGLTPNTMAKQLYRIRKGLMHCIEKHLKESNQALR